MGDVFRSLAGETLKGQLMRHFLRMWKRTFICASQPSPMCSDLGTEGRNHTLYCIKTAWVLALRRAGLDRDSAMYRVKAGDGLYSPSLNFPFCKWGFFFDIAWLFLDLECFSRGKRSRPFGEEHLVNGNNDSFRFLVLFLISHNTIWILDVLSKKVQWIQHWYRRQI